MKVSTLLQIFLCVVSLSSGVAVGAVAVAEEPDRSNAGTTVRETAPFTALSEPGVPVKKGRCAAEELLPNSTAPTWDSPAQTTQCGMLETDNLIIDQGIGSGVRQQMMVTTAKYGLSPRLEIRWGLPGRILQDGGAARRTGMTDQWAGVCFRFHDQGHWMPDLALDYAVKIPSANPAKGFGTGYTDHLLTFIASRDFGNTHIDFNTVGTIAGGPGGHDGAPQFGAAFTRPFGSKLLWTVEAYGGPQPGTEDRYGAVLAGGAWGIRPWLSLNAGYSRAYTAGSPREQVLMGLIYTMRARRSQL